MAVTEHGNTEHSGYELVRTTLVQAVGADPAALTPRTALGDLRLDSLALVELALALEDRTGKPMTGVTEHSTLAEVAELIDAVGIDAVDTEPSVPPARAPGPVVGIVR
ncbi:phosphopantetheine-binding protein [Streptomyces morookaense]|uniref:phosphopantetheine-binding protein n=1 Tax=Streptomyces morookaense TaxID=1970 RepID=UPI0033CC46BF